MLNEHSAPPGDHRTADDNVGRSRLDGVRAISGRLKALVGDTLSALVLFPVSATYLLSYTALVYSGPLAFGRPAGLAAMLVTSLVAGLVTGLASSFRFACGTLDNNATAIMAMVAAAIAGEMGREAEPRSLLATVIVGMAIAGVVAGASLLCLGLGRAGAIVRLMPLQVMAGFVGTTGWILAAGGLRVALGRPPGLDMFSDPAANLRLAAMAAMAGAFGYVAPRARSPFVLPTLIALCIFAHHAVFGFLGVGLAAQRAGGWLIAFPSNLEPSIPWRWDTLAHVDWTALSHQALALVVLALVCPISLLLTATGLETATRREARIDRELVAGGLSSLASGLAGGTIGFVTFARSMTLQEAGAQSRLAPLLATLLTGVLPFVFPSVLGVIPVTALGGLLFFLGLSLLYKWVYQTKAKMPLGEWAAIPIVVALSVHYDVIVGIFAGVVIGCVHFTVTYGLGAPVRARYFGDVAVSNVWRAHGDRELLWRTAQERLVLYLQGFLFFGVANRLLKAVRAEIDRTKDLRWLILDLGGVDGVDSSAVSSFERICEVAAERNIGVLFAAMPDEIAARLRKAHRPDGATPVFAPSLDEALEWCEERALAAAGGERCEPETLSATLAAQFGPETARVFLDHFTMGDIPAGAELMTQGAVTDDLAFIESGRASVLVSYEGRAPMRVRTLVAGTMVGELGFYTGGPRTATVRAETDCRIIRVAPADVRRLEETHPHLALAFHSLIARRLCLRIHDKDHLIAGLMRSMRRRAL
ncbi:SulP family inorganic anion transporter [Methylocystis echinoides]|uniref:SulP family inorganic anion transporter n=1 Tax=Methylocystis echinoides TaxID=29468 RepID=UPI00342CF94A